ncbi:MAG: hypothetical protein A2070_08130 [Bdellovibrionales bacterium GWC1_52_8]|nr:MAG: hypothetical protein A2Z97_10450 [Bdellovibrionales bacterium GWB1_52_6]OFZ06006.1 MAG: hypothetical protein A2X97_01570 [Bdellovibrionales bacterium GWA1_52_35]OFZ33054.1 MAG: hypothetical protein A2070_08130 [Bdellovibrionales bacterium GWC1_52_8]HCM39371.1 MFS transporter [Bdellovibrionales bacterium]
MIGNLGESLSALKNTNYRRYFIGQAASVTGSWMQSTVQAWLVYRLSHSGAWLGIITFCLQMPAFLLSPVAGVLADHSDRRRILIWTSGVGMAQAFLLAFLVFTNSVQLWHVAVLSVVLGLMTAFDLTTRHAFAVDLVGKKQLPSAIACNSLIINSSRIIGPALAGILITFLSEGWCFLLNGLSYLAVIGGLLLITIPEGRKKLLRTGTHLQEIREALTYVKKNRTISGLLWTSTFMSFFGLAFAVLLPVFAKEQLQGDASTLAWLTGATGVGAIVGALGGMSHPKFVSQIEARLPLVFILLGASLILLGQSHFLPLSIFAVFGIGLFLMGTFPALNSAIQQNVDDFLRGRVLSLYTMSFLGAAPLGGLLAGWASDQIGASLVQLASGLVFIAASAVLFAFKRING